MKKINNTLKQASALAFRAQGGFTLVEILVVMTILGLLAALIIPNVIGRLDKAKVQQCQTQIKNLETACDMFKLDVGRYPNSLDELANATGEGWDGPYVKHGQLPKDPWREEYHLEQVNGGKDIRIYSNGGGEQVISNFGEKD